MKENEFPSFGEKIRRGAGLPRPTPVRVVCAARQGGASSRPYGSGRLISWSIYDCYILGASAPLCFDCNGRLGHQPAHRGQCHRAGAHAQHRQDRARVAAHGGENVRRGGGTAGRTDGQLRSRTPEYRRGQACLAGLYPRERGDQGRLVLPESGAAQSY